MAESQRPVLVALQNKTTSSRIKPDKPKMADNGGRKPLTKYGRKDTKLCFQEILTLSNEYSTPYLTTIHKR